MNRIEKLSELFSKFPGIGPRQAKRFVYFLLTRDASFIKEFLTLVGDVKDAVATCSSCFRFFQVEAGNSALCSICRNKNRNRSELMIVSHDIDFENVEKSNAYEGLYFILGGTVPILEKDPSKRIRDRELLKTIEERSKKNSLKEVVLALSANPEGENTADYLQKLIAPFAKKYTFQISLLGRGLSTGTELEYSDAETIKNALANRK